LIHERAQKMTKCAGWLMTLGSWKLTKALWTCGATSDLVKSLLQERWREIGQHGSELSK